MESGKATHLLVGRYVNNMLFRPGKTFQGHGPPKGHCLP